MEPADPELNTVAVLADNSGLGKFTIENVPFGNYVLYIKRPGYLARAMNITVSPSDPDVIELASLGDNENGVFKLWYGDCNDDWVVDNLDVMMVTEQMDMGVNAYHPKYSPACDMNGDALVDNLDVMMIIEHWDWCILDYPGADEVDIWASPPEKPKAKKELEIISGNIYHISLTSEDIASFNGQTYTLTYDASKLRLLDFAAQTGGGSVSAGPVAGTGLKILSHSGGELRFIFNRDIPAGGTWPGIITVLKFQALGSGTAAINIR